MVIYILNHYVKNKMYRAVYLTCYHLSKKRGGNKINLYVFLKDIQTNTYKFKVLYSSIGIKKPLARARRNGGF